MFDVPYPLFVFKSSFWNDDSQDWGVFVSGCLFCDLHVVRYTELNLSGNALCDQGQVPLTAFFVGPGVFLWAKWQFTRYPSFQSCLFSPVAKDILQCICLLTVWLRRTHTCWICGRQSAYHHTTRQVMCILNGHILKPLHLHQPVLKITWNFNSLKS